MADFATVLARYAAMPDKSDFVPVEEDGKPVFLYADETGFAKAGYLAFLLGMTPEFRRSERQRIFAVLETYGGEIGDEVEEGEADAELGDETNILVSSYDDAPIIKLVNQLIINAVKAGTSDIHFEGRENAFLVRFRIDGKLKTVKKYPKNVQEPIIARLKVIAEMDVAEGRKAQDGRINLKVGNRTIDIRVSTIPSITGEKVVLRLLERSTEFTTLDQIGMSGELLSRYRPFLERTSGIILVTGPTGSGKTTTLYASMLAINREDKNVVTIEDPVEYHIDNITQVQVNPAVGLSFASAIRSFLRQDPDIILVGEIRDEETAETAIQASLTGHLVLSTLHTNDSPTAIARLVEMDIEPFLISSSVLAVIGQRLLRRVCPHCAERVQASDAVRELFAEFGVTITDYLAGRGCDHCFDTGYRGRIGVFELLTLTDDVRVLINKKASAFEIRKTAETQGYRSMLSQGVELVQKGITTPEELLAVTRMG